MGSKKKKGGSAKKEKEGGEEAPAPPPVIKENWINVQFMLPVWSHMNFAMKFKENTRIFTIKKILQNRHGKMDKLKLFFNKCDEENEIHDEMLTLADCGFQGHPTHPAEIQTDPAIPTILLWYEYTPQESSDPVLLYFGTK